MKRGVTMRKEITKVKSSKYKKISELTKEDRELIDLDRDVTGISHYSDEYYYNNILHYNYE